ncbi:MAG: hypothetical protein GWO41_01485, partial [candidate division Zixibacteria bacterium]|nr:hypothetical protein [candidate division Zixibacteria bacterium]
ADDLPLWNNVTPEGLERIRYAVLKLSGGDLAVLATAVQEANIDWRDVLVMAGFGHDPEIHLTWWPEK